PSITLRTFHVLALVSGLMTAAFAANSMRVLHNFAAPPADGEQPTAGLIADAAGNLYGTAVGGTTNNGIVFKLSPPSTQGGAWTETILYSFLGSTDGSDPAGGLIFDAAGNLYGSTFQNGYHNFCCGTVYELSPPTGGTGSWTLTVLYAFQGGADGNGPMGT